MAGTWHGLTNQPSFITSTMILLTDGRVMVQEEATKHWHALKPDSSGSYRNGTWQSLGDMSIWRRYYASGTLKDGRVIICGGEQSGGGGDTNICEIYDPVNDSWSIIPSPSGWSTVGDAACCLLPDGRLLIGSIDPGTQCAIYDPSTNSWSSAASSTVTASEESWVLLPDSTIVTVQCFSPFKAEKYVISSNVWKSEGTPPVSLVNSTMNEIGPAVLLYNGNVIFFGADGSSGHGKTALYTPPSTPGGTGTWVAGPDIPHVGGQAMVCNDCPCTLMPNGKVLVTTANYFSDNWGYPVNFFEYDPVTNTIYSVPNPSNNNNFPIGNPGDYWSRMMLLPSGEVMFSAGSNNIQVYEPDGAPQNSWRPHIDTVTPHNGLLTTEYFTVTGTQVNGLSQANMYGDDCTPSTNYPVAQLTNQFTGDVYYQRTYDFSTMAVATGSSVQSFNFSAVGLPGGRYDLTIIANGIPSNVVTVNMFYVNLKNILDARAKDIIEIIGKEVAEGDPWNQFQWIGDPEIVELKSQVRSLQNSVSRLTSMIKTSELPSVGKDLKKKEIKGNGVKAKSGSKQEA